MEEIATRILEEKNLPADFSHRCACIAGLEYAAGKDYADARRFKAQYIEADHEVRKLRAINSRVIEMAQKIRSDLLRSNFLTGNDHFDGLCALIDLCLGREKPKV